MAGWRIETRYFAAVVLAIAGALVSAAPLHAGPATPLYMVGAYNGIGWIGLSYSSSPPGSLVNSYSDSNSSGTGKAAVEFGAVHAYSYAIANGNLEYTPVSLLTEGDSSFSLTGIEVTGLGPGPISVSLNLLFSGFVSSAPNDGSKALDMAGVAVNADIMDGSNSSLVQYSYTVMDGEEFSNSFPPTVTFINGSGTGQFKVGPILVTPNAPYLDIHFSINAWVNAVAMEGRTAEGESNFYHTLGFVTDGPVFDLPYGYTVNASTPEGKIENNRYTPSVPEPASWTLLLAGLAVISPIVKRGASRRKRT